MNRLMLVLLALWWSLPAHANHPTDLDHLLRQALDAERHDARLRKERETRFLAAHADRKQLLDDVQEQLANERARSERLKATFENNERELAELQAELQRRSGDLGELFGTVRQYAGELAPLFGESLVSVQRPGRDRWLAVLAESKRLPDITELERFWLLVRNEIMEAGRVVRFASSVTGRDGVAIAREVVRLGLFNAVSDGHYLKYLPESGQLLELARQPDSGDLRRVAALQNAQDGRVEVAIDPTRGVLLGLLVETPGLVERVRQGGIVGYVIVALGLIGLLVGSVRLLSLAGVGRRVKRQLNRIEEPRDDNPLGRVLAVPGQHAGLDAENLALQIDEAIIREVPSLTRGEGLVKLLAAVTPLLGLLGTVVGMIVTFQSITLFGTGDPKLMANGISQALVTTALGLVVAIPLLFLHALLNARSKVLVQILDEQSAGLLAAREEQQR